MLKKNYFLAIAFFCFISACKKNGQNTIENFDVANYNVQLKRLTGNVGKVHNNGLDVALRSSILITHNKLQFNRRQVQSLFPTAPDPENPGQEASESSALAACENYINNQPEFSGLNLSTSPDVMLSINSSATIRTPSHLSNQLDSVLNILNQYNLISSRELGMVEELNDIFINGYSLNLNQADANYYFATELQALRNQHMNIVWNVNEGELFLGMLEVAINSNIYWHSNLSNETQGFRTSKTMTLSNELLPADPTLPEEPLVQVDAIGYIFGWGKAVLSDYNNNKLNPSGQWHRIGQGALTALQASTLGGWRKWFGDGDPENPSIDNPGNGSNNNPLSLPMPLPTPVIAYWISVSDAEVSNTVDNSFSTPIYLNSADNKYYSDAIFSNVVPDGLYKHPENFYNNKFHRIINGQVTAILAIDFTP
ncbi:hypothetical protein [Pedobacter sp.]|uniref:hypothetical protein n=1 Tax=Pedobacter sp. TaxID=1411316 RepID=UPI0031DA7074